MTYDEKIAWAAGVVDPESGDCPDVGCLLAEALDDTDWMWEDEL